MSSHDIIRGWKNPEHQANFGEVEQQTLPNHSSGLIELTEDDSENISGGWCYPTHYAPAPYYPAPYYPAPYKY
jgi:mersacidin/lichenicidin family type 2 lantibiotic